MCLKGEKKGGWGALFFCLIFTKCLRHPGIQRKQLMPSWCWYILVPAVRHTHDSFKDTSCSRLWYFTHRLQLETTSLARRWVKSRSSLCCVGVRSATHIACVSVKPQRDVWCGLWRLKSRAALRWWSLQEISWRTAALLSLKIKIIQALTSKVALSQMYSDEFAVYSVAPLLHKSHRRKEGCVALHAVLNNPACRFINTG